MGALGYVLSANTIVNTKGGEGERVQALHPLVTGGSLGRPIMKGAQHCPATAASMSSRS